MKESIKIALVVTFVLGILALTNLIAGGLWR